MTNAVIERRGAKVAFITTEGFRDTLEMAYEHRYDQYDLLVTKPLPLVPRELRFPVPERLAADGRVLRTLDRQALADIADILIARKVEAVAIGFLHSYVNSDHERAAAVILKPKLPGALNRNWSMVEQAGGRVAGLAFDRDALEIGQEVAGPALIIDTGTTLMVPTGFTARVVPAGHLLIQRNVVAAVESAA